MGLEVLIQVIVGSGRMKLGGRLETEQKMIKILNVSGERGAEVGRNEGDQCVGRGVQLTGGGLGLLRAWGAGRKRKSLGLENVGSNQGTDEYS